VGFVQERIIEWGDCDAAGIVYYPNYFRWIDGTFHALGRAAGFDQTTLARDFGLMGTPLMESGLRFVSPGRYHDRLRIEARISRLGGSGLTVEYALAIGERAVAEGREVRAFVAEVDGRLKAVPIPAPIRAALEAFVG
jgi:YbgC/YbaW family acyl-CoA thioester hydrolase